MNPQQPQPTDAMNQPPNNMPPSGTNPDEAMANLGFVNTMMSHLLEYKASKNGQKPVTSQGGNPNMGQQKSQPTEQKPPEPNPQDQKMDDHKKRVDDMEVNTNKEIEGLKTELEQVKKSDEENKIKVDDIQKTLKEIVNGK